MWRQTLAGLAIVGLTSLATAGVADASHDTPASGVPTPRMDRNAANVFVVLANRSGREISLKLDTGCIYARGCSERGPDAPVVVTIPGHRSIDIWGKTTAGTDLRGWVNWNISPSCPAELTSADAACTPTYRRVELRWKRPAIGWSWMSVEGLHGTWGLDERTFAVNQTEKWPLWGKEGYFKVVGTRIENFASGTTVFKVDFLPAR